MGETTYIMHLPTPGMTVDEVIESYHQQHKGHGNDLDFLTMSLWLYKAGHYSDAIQFAFKVLPTDDHSESSPVTADKLAAHAAFIAACERARPLFEQAALEIEGKIEGSQTMAGYFQSLEGMRNDPNL